MILDKINNLNEMQRKAVLKIDGSLLLIAGAGSGKTRVLTHRIAYMIEQGINPFNIIAITFTNKAAKEMKERVCEISEQGRRVLVSTFHSVCVRILKQDIEKLGYTKDFTIYDAEDSSKIIKEIMKEYKVDDKMIPPNMVINEISRQKDKLINAKTFEQESQSDFRLKIISQIYKEYETRLKNNNALDFDDLIFKTVQLFSENQDILESYQNRFKYIMVDEYQDTSLSQYTFIRLLSNKYKNICVVGDDDQSIYGWRGADIRNILNFERDFENTELIKLEQNYRSTKIILDTANSVIKNNFGRKDKSLWTENNEGSLIKYETCRNDREEATFISHEILREVTSGRSYKDFAILYRTNVMSRVLEEQLIFSSIPYKLYGGVNFYSRREIKDIIAYLRILLNPNDEIALRRIINVPKRGIGNTSIQRVQEYAIKNEFSLFEAIGNIEDIPNLERKSRVLAEFYNSIIDFQNSEKELPIPELIENILYKTGYIKELELEGTEDSRNRIENLTEFMNKAIEFENKENIETADNKTLSEFLQDIALIADIDAMEDGENVVTLMTLHSSKGLEFPAVFIAGFEEGVFPTNRALLSNDPSAIEEERRLLYVGITRAKEQLYITNAKTRLQHGNFSNNRASSFFNELPREYLSIVKKESNKVALFVESEEKRGNTYRPQPNYKPKVPVINTPPKNDIPINTNVSLDFSVGDTVSHIKFRKGVVLSIQPAGADYEVTIQFENEKFGTKKLMANLSKLKKV